MGCQMFDVEVLSNIFLEYIEKSIYQYHIIRENTYLK